MIMAKEQITGVDEFSDLQASSIRSLEESSAALKMLQAECIDCSSFFVQGLQLEALKRLGNIVEHLHDFQIFHASLCSVLLIDSTGVKDYKGSLKDSEDKLHAILARFTVLLAAGDLANISSFLSNDIPEALKRFDELVPLMQVDILEINDCLCGNCK